MAYDNLRNDRIALEKAIASAAAGTAPYEGLLLIPSVSSSPAAEELREVFKTGYATEARLRTERQTYTDEYPSVKELQKTLDVQRTKTIPDLANKLLQQLREREQDYERRIAGQSRELREIPSRTMDEMRLERAVTVSSGLYATLKNRHAETKLAAVSAVPDVSVLDTALAPLTPTKATKGKMFLGGLGGGIALAFGLVFLLDMMDRRVRYTSQVTTELGMLIAGAVPRVPKRGINASSPEQVLQFVEAFRSLRMHVTHGVNRTPVVVAVTSAAPRDGKSLIAGNLALSFAEAGLQTVLVDGDTRRGALHKMFGVKITGGLTDYLEASIDEAQVVRTTSYQHLSFVSCGRRNTRSPEFLTSMRLKKLIEHLSRHSTS
jgi:tyrosine-protein kinase Etk/Wzc